jgi:pteridine reductase
MTATFPVAVVTGGARRIGAAIARTLHRAGYDIALHYRSSAADAGELAAALNAARADSCTAFQADLAIAEEAQRLGAEICSHYPAVQVLVNNASGYQHTTLEQAGPEHFDAMLGSNLRGAYFLTQALLPGLRAAGGSIVNIIDAHLERPVSGYSAYNAAKAGLASLTRSLAVELGPELRVNGIAPGAILWPEHAEEGWDAAARRRILDNTPLARLGQAEEIASLALFLARDGTFITGQVIAVDGGLSLASVQ